MSSISNRDELVNERFLITQDGQLMAGLEYTNRAEAEASVMWLGDGCQVVTWLEGMRDDLTAKGWRCIPAARIDGKMQPLGGYAEGQVYPASARQWQNAEAVAVALPANYLLIDLDGYKPGAATVGQVADALELTVEQLNRAKVQEREGGSSLHWVFRGPESCNVKASTGEWLPSVDVKTGNSNGLIYIKPGKVATFPAVAEVQPFPANPRRTLPVAAIEPPRALAPVRVATEPTPAGLALLDEVIGKLADCAEGGRNDALNVAAVRLGHYVAGGELPGELVETRLMDAAKALGLSHSEARATIQSGMRKGQSEPQRLKETVAAEVFAQPVEVPAAGCEYLPFESLQVRPEQMLNDHLADARIIIARSLNRLATFEGEPHWWTGSEWSPADDALLRRYVGNVMEGDQLAKVTKSRIDGTVSLILDHAPMLGRIDPPSRLVFFRNGAFNPETGTLAPHDPVNANSRTLAVDYDPAAVAPTWRAWLADIFQSEPERIGLLQEIMGWTLCRDNLGIEKAVIMVGPSRSGKGTIIRVMQALLQGAAGVFHLPQLDSGKVLASMRACNVAIDPDTASPARGNARQIVGLFKTITANERVAVQLLYTQKCWQGALDCKLLLAANSVPTLWDDSAATAQRWIPLVFDRGFVGKEDTSLPQRLIAELPGIAAWALAGLQRLMDQGRFTLPESSRNELENMIQSGSPVEQFIDECLTFGADHRIADATLWTAYGAWLARTGHEGMTRRNLMKALEDATRAKGVRRHKSVRIGISDHRGFYGVTLKSSAEGVNVLPFANH
jgi:putative DNA primase/helicase